jgi:hypothetical protein
VAYRELAHVDLEGYVNTHGAFELHHVSILGHVAVLAADREDLFSPLLSRPLLRT